LIEILLTAENAEHAESLWFVVHRKISQRLPKLTGNFLATKTPSREEELAADCPD
jgi:hypothetical protein